MNRTYKEKIRAPSPIMECLLLLPPPPPGRRPLAYMSIIPSIGGALFASLLRFFSCGAFFHHVGHERPQKFSKGGASPKTPKDKKRPPHGKKKTPYGEKTPPLGKNIAKKAPTKRKCSKKAPHITKLFQMIFQGGDSLLFHPPPCEHP